MFRVILALVAAVCVLGAPSPAATPAGCPAGAVGSGELLICPKTGSCESQSTTDAIFAAGSCKTIAHAKEIGNAAGCGNTFTNGVRVDCNTTTNEPNSINVPHVGHFKNCTTLATPILCVNDAENGKYSEIIHCCS